MDLGKGELARIDRKILSGLGRDEVHRMVRVPVAGAVWSTWRRYCDAVGISMGRAIAGLVVHELGTVVARDWGDGSVFGAELERRFAARIEGLDVRERRLNERERVLRASEQRLRTEERMLRVSRSPLASASKIGRNEPCPCGSGLKHKHCHGLASRYT
jgi:uncharacterized protein YchJ